MAETGSGLNWYVLRAVSGQEKKIKSYIENEIARQKLGEYVPQILIPSEKVFEMRNGKKRVREKNFFPGYIIISADLSQGEVYHIITSIPGDRKSTRLNSSHVKSSYAVFCL